jgi:hypothetical protein
MARTREEILTDLRVKEPQRFEATLDRNTYPDGRKPYSPDQYESSLQTSADIIFANETAKDQADQDTSNAKLIVGRLRNNTATNDDRNKAILWLIKQVRSDV